MTDSDLKMFQFISRNRMLRELWEAVQRELATSDCCGLGRYRTYLFPHVVSSKDIDHWISMALQKPEGKDRDEFYGVCNHETTREDIDRMIFGG
jgi:hypothetical protein